MTSAPVTPEQVYQILSDRTSVKMLKTAYSGLKFSSNDLGGNLSKKRFYTKLKRLCRAGLVEKNRNSVYKTTTFGSLVYNGQVKMLDESLASYWPLKTIDVLKARQDFPPEQSESIINQVIQGCNLKNYVNSTHLSGFSIIKDFNSLVVEVIKLLYNAEKEIFFASRYHDPHASSKMIEKFNQGLTLHILDGNPEPVSIENRINAILRTPPNNETLQLVKRMIRSPRFEIRKAAVPASFLVVDGHQVIYESINFNSPEQFTIAIANYDDAYLGQQFIKYFQLLSKESKSVQFCESIKTSSG
jgi:hypothetical protein